MKTIIIYIEMDIQFTFLILKWSYTMKKSLTTALILGSFALFSQPSLADILVYNGQHKDGGVEKAAVEFTKQTGIKVNFKYGKSAELTGLLKEEKDRSPADIFVAESTSPFLSLSASHLLAQIDESAIKNTEAPNVAQSEDKTFVSLGVRSRVLAYNPEKISENDLPKTWTEMVNDPKWKNRFSYHPGSGALVDQIAVYKKLHGLKKTKAFLVAMKENGQSIKGHMPALKKVDIGELDAAMINQYYLERLYTEKGGEDNVKAKIHYMRNGDADSALSFSAAAILKSSKHINEAQKFIIFLTGKQGQELYVADSGEWPTNPNAKLPVKYLESLSSLNPPKTTFTTKEESDEAKALIKEAGIQ